MEKMNCLVLGGDKRQLYCASYLLKQGYEVSLFGFDKLVQKDNRLLEFYNLNVAVNLADVIIFPPAFNGDGNIPMTFGSETITLKDVLCSTHETKTVIAGALSEKAKSQLTQKKLCLLTINANEEYLLKNAAITAEGAVYLAMLESERAIFFEKVLILGFGRIAKHLAAVLSGYGCEITVGARKQEALFEARLKGLKTTDLSELKEVKDFSFIFNTIPAKLELPEYKLNKDSVLIDLAPGYGNAWIHMVNAGGLPGKYAPESAGIYLGQTIISLLSEVKYE